MDGKQQTMLLSVARDAVCAAVRKQAYVAPKTDEPAMTAHCGCFVTLKNRGRLRGCLGQFTSDRPLIDLVVEMAQASATSDPRFLSQPIASRELDDLDMEISVLSPLKRTGDPLSLRLGVDGIYIGDSRDIVVASTNVPMAKSERARNVQGPGLDTVDGDARPRRRGGGRNAKRT